jgi:hypothetical protein
MGGFGSGRCVTRQKTDDCVSIDIRAWRREGVLDCALPVCIFQLRSGDVTVRGWAHIERQHCTLTITCHRDDGTRWADHDKVICFDFTPCHYGYTRTWFSCPACGRRVAILYHDQNHHWSCRKCSHLLYPSQCEAEFERLKRRARKIDAQLGNGQRPRNMHKRTYTTLKHERTKTQTAIDRAFVEMAERFLESVRERKRR